jgi:hypothetical protein
LTADLNPDLRGPGRTGRSAWPHARKTVQVKVGPDTLLPPADNPLAEGDYLTCDTFDVRILRWLLSSCCLVLEPLAVSRVLIDSEACHDRGQVLVEEELEVVRRVIDVHCT